MFSGEMERCEANLIPFALEILGGDMGKKAGLL